MESADYLTPTDRIDRRHSPRLPYFAEVRLVGRSELYFHPANNLSLGGLFLRSEHPLPIGTRVKVELRDTNGQPFTVKAVVAWYQDSAKPGTPEALAQPPIEAGMGVKFHALEPLDVLRLRQLIAAQRPSNEE